MSDSIQVAIKVRPLIKRERDDSLAVQWVVQGNSISPVDPELKKRGEGGFFFDHIFDLDKTNSDVFNVAVKPIVDAAVKGFNGTIFAYGQTSSGKTYTMMGTPDEPGIVPLAIEYMFDAVANTMGREFLLRVSYLEIYNERINDLLNRDSIDLKVHEDVNGQVHVKCKEVVANCPENVLSIMKKGDKHRRIGETNMNERSSRSHTIFRITIESREAMADSNGAIQVSQLNLVDLAGSERARQTGATGERFKEGKHINMSLSALGLVIMQLSESPANSKYVNFRDSKLTRILQASLGGNAMTTIICAVTPAALEETQCTLAFASRAKSVKNKPQLNEVMSDAALLKRYAKQLAKLNAELEKAKQVNRCAEVEEMESKLQEKDRVNQLLEERIELLKTRIVSGVNNSASVESFDSRSKRRRTWGGPTTFQHSFVLPTIEEQDCKETSVNSNKKRQMRQRQSIIQTPVIDIVNEKFQTAVADFELELIESERNWERGRYSEDSVDFEEDNYISTRKPENRVKFMDDVSVYRISYDGNIEDTPDRMRSLSPPESNNEKSPGTPKEILRERITYLTDEYTTLKAFTTLEKQLFTEEGVEYKNLDNNETLNYMKKSVADSEMMYLELNKKYSELKSEHLQLALEHEDTVKECERLREKVNSVSTIQDKLDSMANEKSLLQSTMNETLKRLKVLEEERTDYAFQMDMLKEKHKAREQELENALQMAWKEHADNTNKEKSDNVIHLQSLVDSLSKELEGLRTRLKIPISAGQPVYVENRNVTSKLEESDKNELTLVEMEMNKLEIANLKEIIAEKTNEVVACTKIIEDIRSENKCLQTHVKSLLTSLTSQDITVQDTADKLEELYGSSPEIAFEQLYIESVSSSKEIQNKSNALDESDARLKEIIPCTEGESILKDVQCNDAIDLQVKTCIVEANDRNKQILSNGLDTGDDDTKESHGILKARLDEVILENTELKSKIEIFVREMTEQVSAAVDLDSLKICLAKHLSERDVNMHELQTDNANLKERIIVMESDITLCKDEKCVMEKTIEDLEEKLRRAQKLESQLVELDSEKTELERKSVELQKMLNENILESNVKGTRDYENEIKNLNSCTVNLQNSMKNIEVENIELKSQLHKLSVDYENELIGLREKTEEQERVLHTLEEDKRTLAARLDKLQETETMETISTPNTSISIKSVTIEAHSVVEKSHESKSLQNEKETDSIFDNFSYFEDINSSYNQNDSVFERETQDVADTSLFEDITKSKDVSILKKKIKELEDTNKRLEVVNKEFFSKIADEKDYEYMNKVYELMSTKISLENENTKLAENLKVKIQESDEIKNDIQGLKLGIEKLEQTIYLLTTENMDMSSKLSTEKERTKEVEVNFQNLVDDLYARVSKITEEKANLENELAIYQEQLEIQQTTITVATEEEVKKKFIELEEKIDTLTSENIELSSNLKEKIEELDKIKESKALLYNHECTYKQEFENLLAKCNVLETENIELSNNLMERIEEFDSVNETCNLLKNKLEFFMKNQSHASMDSSENDVDLLKMENSQLKAESIELKTKVTILSEENAKYSENLLETMEELDNIRCADNSDDRSLHLSMKYDNSVLDSSDKPMADENVQSLTNTVKLLQKKVDYLTYLNKKLSDLKLSSCAQCTHVKELNENRRALKVEVKRLNHKLQDLQRKFEQKYADTEVLRSKANEELNLSICDITLNGSMTEGMSVSFVEEKVQILNNELEALKEDHDKLSNLYKEKCNELEKLNDSNICEVSSSQINIDPPQAKKTKVTIDRIQVDINKLSEDLQQLKKNNAGVRESLHKFINEKSNMQNEIDLLRSTKEELDKKLTNAEMSVVTAEEKVKILDNEITDLNQEIERLRTFEKDAENERLILEADVECLRAEKVDSERQKIELHKSLSDLKEINSSLIIELEAVKEEREELIRHRTNVQDVITEKEKKLKEVNVNLNKYINDNVSLQAEITKLHTIIQNDNINSKENESNDRTKCNANEHLEEENAKDCTKILSMYEKLNKEFETARRAIVKEIEALKPKTENSNFSDKSVVELFRTFLRAVMLKEQEIIKAVQDRFERDKEKLEDEKRQCRDAEKRVTVWAKELETEVEKLQGDLSVQENKNKELYSETKKLENLLQECNHEKQLLKEKIVVLETDFNSMQTIFDKQTRTDDKQDEANYAAQERERLAIVAVKKREAELQSRFDSEKEQYSKRVEELTCTVESYKTKNMDLQSNLEGLEANERQLKNIIDMKSNDLAKSCQRIEKLEAEMEQLTDTYNQLNHDKSSKVRHIEEITALLKSKCDMLSEFKTKLETLTPEYDILKEQLRERKLNTEKYKNELDVLKVDSEKQINTIKDKLDAEEIKSGGLNKQLIELSNKNTVLSMDLEALREKFDELEKCNAKLVQKMRNSTSKVKVEAQVEELQDQIKTLQNNLEGASNRITELQDGKSQVMRDLIELRGKYESLCQENNKVQRSMTAHRTKQMTSDLIELRGKYEVLLQEKNKVALSLEEKKLLLMQAEKELTNYKNEIEQLRNKNKELDEEMDDMVKVIHELQRDNAELTDKLFAPKADSSSNDHMNLDTRTMEDLNYKNQVERLKRQNKEQTKKIDDMMNTFDTLRKENSDLRAKILDLEETKSGNNSRSASPLFEITRRKQRRSDLFNQKRQLEDVGDSDAIANESIECRCTVLKQKVRELELELVSKNGKIATLEIQIQSENFPYQKKCKDLEENLLAFRNKNATLKVEVKRLQRAMMETSVRECEVCRKRHTNKRDQFTQCMPEHKTFLSGTSSGIVDEHIQNHRIRKLENENSVMKNLCRCRMKRIKELEQEVTELEARVNPDNAVSLGSAKKNISNQTTKSSSHRVKLSHTSEQSSWR